MSAQRASQLVEAGMWLRLSGDHEGAKRLFEQALKLDPSNVRARQLLDSPPPAAAQQQPGGAVSNLDWGLATGQAPTPPPIAPAAPHVIKTSNTRPFGENAPAGTHTVRLGEAAAPEIPEAPRFEDPHGEVMITGADDERAPENSTLVFGMSGVPVPPVPSAGSSDVPTGGTMVFGGSAVRGKEAPPAGPGDVPTGGTMVFGGSAGRGKDAPPAVPPVSGDVATGGTLVFGGAAVRGKDAPPAVPPAGASGTLVFGSTKQPEAPAAAPATRQPSTLVFGTSKEPEGGPGGTLVFGSQGMAAPPPVAPVVPQSSTLQFGATSREQPGAQQPRREQTLEFGSLPREQAPKPLPEPDTLKYGESPREKAVTTDPGLPPFAVDEQPPEPEYAPVKSSSTLQFNFDDMVAGPMSSPPVPTAPPEVQQTAWDRSNPRIDISQINAGGEGGGFDLHLDAGPSAKPRSPVQLKAEVATLLSGAKDLLDLDDHSGAMELISKALDLDPADAAALKLKDRSERTLEAMYESKLGDLAQTPRVKLKEDEIIWLNLDHRAGFVLAQIDGSVCFEDLFAVSGMSRLDTARILAQLVEEGVITKG